MTGFARVILPILVIFITLLIVGTIVYGIYNIYQNKKQIDQNWPEYKCKPYVFPFAGWLIGPSNTNPMDNFRDCSWLIFKSFFQVLIAPFITIITLIVSILTNFNQDIQNIRKMVNYMRSSMRSLALDIYQKIYNAYYRIAYIYKAFMKVFLDIFNTMQSSFDVLMYSYYSLSSMWNGPIGTSARFFGGVGQDVKNVVQGVGQDVKDAGQDINKFLCFDGHTKIKLANGKLKSIKKIGLGDETLGGKVLAVYIFKQDHPEDMYIIDSKNNSLNDSVNNSVNTNDIVSGSHLILENSVWIRVKDSTRAVPYHTHKNEIYSKKYIYSLRTSDSLIFTTSAVYRDYDQINDNEINKNILINQCVNLNHPLHKNINNFKTCYQPDGQSDDQMDGSNNYRPYFDYRCKIDMEDYSIKCIRDVNIGDKILNGGKVIGIVRACRENTPVYNYNFKNALKDNIICSQGTVINSKNHYCVHIYQDANATKVNNYDKDVMYSLLTEKGTISINNTIFRDHDVNRLFDQVVEKYIEDSLNK